MPIEGKWKLLRKLCAAAWVALVVTVGANLVLSPADYAAIQDFMVPWYAAVIACAGVTSMAVMLAPRTKHCTNCGHTWRTGK